MSDPEALPALLARIMPAQALAECGQPGLEWLGLAEPPPEGTPETSHPPDPKSAGSSQVAQGGPMEAGLSSQSQPQSLPQRQSPSQSLGLDKDVELLLEDDPLTTMREMLEPTPQSLEPQVSILADGLSVKQQVQELESPQRSSNASVGARSRQASQSPSTGVEVETVLAGATTSIASTLPAGAATANRSLGGSSAADVSDSPDAAIGSAQRVEHDSTKKTRLVDRLSQPPPATSKAKAASAMTAKGPARLSPSPASRAAPGRAACSSPGKSRHSPRQGAGSAVSSPPKRRTTVEVPGLRDYLVDDSMLPTDCNTTGLEFRRTKHLEDLCGENHFASWGSVISGVDDGDGWVWVSGKGYLPMTWYGVPLLSLRATSSNEPAEESVAAAAAAARTGRGISPTFRFDGFPSLPEVQPSFNLGAPLSPGGAFSPRWKAMNMVANHFPARGGTGGSHSPTPQRLSPRSSPAPSRSTMPAAGHSGRISPARNALSSPRRPARATVGTASAATSAALAQQAAEVPLGDAVPISSPRGHQKSSHQPQQKVQTQASVQKASPRPSHPTSPKARPEWQDVSTAIRKNPSPKKQHSQQSGPATAAAGATSSPAAAAPAAASAASAQPSTPAAPLQGARPRSPISLARQQAQDARRSSPTPKQRAEATPSTAHAQPAHTEAQAHGVRRASPAKRTSPPPPPPPPPQGSASSFEPEPAKARSKETSQSSGPPQQEQQDDHQTADREEEAKPTTSSNSISWVTDLPSWKAEVKQRYIESLKEKAAADNIAAVAMTMVPTSSSQREKPSVPLLNLAAASLSMSQQGSAPAQAVTSAAMSHAESLQRTAGLSELSPRQDQDDQALATNTTNSIASAMATPTMATKISPRTALEGAQKNTNSEKKQLEPAGSEQGSKGESQKVGVPADPRKSSRQSPRTEARPGRPNAKASSPPSAASHGFGATAAGAAASSPAPLPASAGKEEPEPGSKTQRPRRSSRPSPTAKRDDPTSAARQAPEAGMDSHPDNRANVANKRNSLQSSPRLAKPDLATHEQELQQSRRRRKQQLDTNHPAATTVAKHAEDSRSHTAGRCNLSSSNNSLGIACPDGQRVTEQPLNTNTDEAASKQGSKRGGSKDKRQSQAARPEWDSRFTLAAMLEKEEHEQQRRQERLLQRMAFLEEKKRRLAEQDEGPNGESNAKSARFHQERQACQKPGSGARLCQSQTTLRSSPVSQPGVPDEEARGWNLGSRVSAPCLGATQEQPPKEKSEVVQDE